jgi:hypothetical protein
MFIDLHKVFFCDFPQLLHEWILRLMDNHAMNWIRQLEWTPVQIEQLQQVNNKFTRVVEFWLDNIVVGFIIELEVDTMKLYSVAENFFYEDLKEGTID